MIIRSFRIISVENECGYSFDANISFTCMKNQKCKSCSLTARLLQTNDNVWWWLNTTKWKHTSALMFNNTHGHFLCPWGLFLRWSFTKCCKRTSIQALLTATQSFRRLVLDSWSAHINQKCLSTAHDVLIYSNSDYRTDGSNPYNPHWHVNHFWWRL